jgi:hypothetical protein
MEPPTQAGANRRFALIGPAFYMGALQPLFGS